MKLETKRGTISVLAVISLLVSISGLVNSLALINVAEQNQLIQIEGINTVSPFAQIVCYVIIFISSVAILVLQKNLIKHKVLIILLNLLQFIVGNMIWSSISTIILCKKTKGIEENVVELPIIERQNRNHKGLYLFLFFVAFVVNYTPIFTNLLDLIEGEIYALPLTIAIMALSIACIIYPIILMRKELKSDFKVLKGNFKTYMEYFIPKLGIFFIIYTVIAATLMILIGEEPTNQNTLNEMPLWESALLAMFYAPIVEESLFRGLLKKGLKSERVFIAMSTIIFGLIHIEFLETNLLLYLYGIIYMMIGYFLAKTYAKTDNIAASIGIHFLWNTIGILSSLLMLL